ncbi:flavin-binding monooxygenase [Amorphoplanes auranticolor]|uniref:Flavin-binding monooxygenase n=2 Tax=Actinoplanes auranticolor TaxID=47988 RepID=A0A919SW54_9ACTN|nr:flavin-binding monooxygenase [Actinoplanes auranticolor]
MRTFAVYSSRMAYSTPSVAVIGAGFGGLGMAVALKRAGIDSFVIFEKGDDVGGIWRENTYPGCGCDVPSHLYSFSFEKYRNSTVRFPAQADILGYLRDVAEKYGLRRHLRTGTPIVAALYDDDTATWTLQTAAGEQHRFDVVISAVGQLHNPKLPEIPGRAEYAGQSFHTATWDAAAELDGKEVTVIGTGSSAAQLLPTVAGRARRVTVYQRTPNWVIPKPSRQFSTATSRALSHAPVLHDVLRAATYLAADTVLSPVISRGWSARPVTALARWHLRRQVRDRDLRARLTPDYPAGCKRIVIDNGFYPALQRDNVELVTDPIARITRDGVETVAGQHRRADVIVYATGFRTTEFLVPMDVVGSGGRKLQREWADGAEAYLGMAVPGFPNLFLVHGPNTILGHNSNVFMIECQVRYIMNCLRMLPGTLEVNDEAMRTYSEWLRRTVGRTVWPAGCLSWYKTESGRVTNPWPASTFQYWRRTRRDPAPAFTVRLPAGRAAVPPDTGLITDRVR